MNFGTQGGLIPGDTIFEVTTLGILSKCYLKVDTALKQILLAATLEVESEPKSLSCGPGRVFPHSRLSCPGDFMRSSW
jgi:hypothetical protein